MHYFLKVMCNLKYFFQRLQNNFQVPLSNMWMNIKQNYNNGKLN